MGLYVVDQVGGLGEPQLVQEEATETGTLLGPLAV
jgi:hypothetical protein